MKLKFFKEEQMEADSRNCKPHEKKQQDVPKVEIWCLEAEAAAVTLLDTVTHLISLAELYNFNFIYILFPDYNPSNN